MKKSLSILVLFSMTLHCASRLGLLDYLYQNRHDIAFAVGLTAEKVIAMCNSNYSHDSTLSLSTEEHHPSGLVYAQEINLFVPENSVACQSVPRLEIPLLPSGYFKRLYSSPMEDIFHPPCI